jgi:hypothetical protein
VTPGRATVLIGGVFLLALIARALLGGGDGERPGGAASAVRVMSHAPPAVYVDVSDLTLGSAAAIPSEPVAVRRGELRAEVAAATRGPVETPATVDSAAGSEPRPTPTPPTTAPVAPSPSPSPQRVRRPRPTPAPTFDDSGTGDFDFPGEP